MRIEHPFLPICDKNSKILILGSFPSVKSRENSFYYGHPQNRFWKIIAKIFEQDVVVTIEQKKELLLRNNIAIWDILKSCEIEGSADLSIKEPVVNDIKKVIENSNINKICFNGNTAYNLYKKYAKQELNIAVHVLPSTSPANASYSFDKLYNIWEESIKGETYE